MMKMEKKIHDMCVQIFITIERIIKIFLLFWANGPLKPSFGGVTDPKTTNAQRNFYNLFQGVPWSVFIE